MGVTVVTGVLVGVGGREAPEPAMVLEMLVALVDLPVAPGEAPAVRAKVAGPVSVVRTDRNHLFQPPPLGQCQP